jgi:hypothetical protein
MAARDLKLSQMAVSTAARGRDDFQIELSGVHHLTASDFIL